MTRGNLHFRLIDDYSFLFFGEGKSNCLFLAHSSMTLYSGIIPGDKPGDQIEFGHMKGKKSTLSGSSLVLNGELSYVSNIIR